MIQIHFHLPNGTEKVGYGKANTRVVGVGFALGLDEIGFGDCGGNCTCGTCHVRLMQGNFAPPNPEEEAVLNTFPKVYPQSRLACQLVLRADTGPVVVHWVP